MSQLRGGAPPDEPQRGEGEGMSVAIGIAHPSMLPSAMTLTAVYVSAAPTIVPKAAATGSAA